MASVGPNYPSTGVDTSAPTGTWSSISNAFASDSTYAQSFVDFGQTTVLRLTNFGITLPADVTITGIVLETLFKSIGEGEAGSPTGEDDIISLVRGGSEVGDNLASVDPGGYPQETPTPVTYGGSSNLWGTTWTKAQIEDSSFGCDLKYVDFFTGNLTAGLDYARITVYYSAGGPVTEVGSGGVLVGGTAIVRSISLNVGSGGVLGGGSANVDVTIGIAGSGGVTVDGTSQSQGYLVEISSGGVIVGGDSSGVIIGGVLGGGTASVNVTRDIVGSGGVTVDGIGLDQKYAIVISNGGIIVGGDVKKEDPVYHYPNAPGIVQEISVSGVASTKANYRTDTSGSITIAGSAVPSAGYRFVSDGRSADKPPDYAGISIGYLNDLNPTKTSFSFTLSYDFRWRINQEINLSYDFTWNMGNLRRYWYRIIGKARDNICPPIQTPDSCCRQYVMNVHARSIEDLCDKLQRMNWKWPIESVQRFSKPADNAAVAEDEANGINYDCNVAEEVDVCAHPVCFDFCVDYDFVESWGCSVDASQTADFAYVGSGSLFTGGSAIVVQSIRTSHFSYVAEGGIGISGDVNYQSSGYLYVPQGGFTTGGSAAIKSTHWSFTGGEWPSLTDTTYGTEVDQFAESSLDEEWLFPERALNPDLSTTVSDVSFGRKSQFLVVKGFGLNVPDGSRILGITVDIRRYSNSMIKDNEVYLVVGEEIVSDNQAKPSSWPLGSPSSGIYGSNFDSWRDPNDPDYLGEWDLEDINNEEFGVAIRVVPTLISSAVYAYIDSINILISYEMPIDQTIHINGEAIVKSSHYQYTSQGSLTVGGSAGFRIGRRFVSLGRGPSGLAAFQIGGTYGRNFHYEATGGLSTGGTGIGISSGYVYEATGGLSLGGESSFKSSHYTWEATGGLSVEGSAVQKAAYRFRNPSGGINVGGTLGLKNVYHYEATGGLNIQGAAGLKSSNFSWVATGGLTLSGGTDYEQSDFSTLESYAGAYAEALSVQVIFGNSGETTNPIIPPTTTLTECDCVGMPLTIPCGHNIIQSNKLSQFATRNNLSIPNRLSLFYSKANDSWQANYHYKGYSSVSNLMEKWDLLFQLQCTDVVGGTLIGKNVWKFAVQITQRNLSTMQTLETRVVIGFLPEPVCAPSTGFKAQMQIDTQTQFVVLTPNSTVYQVVLFDDIGLFKTAFWASNPNLLINVSQTGLSVYPPRFPLVGV